MAKYLDERGDKVSPEETQKVVKVTGVEARQGFLGRPVLLVLVAGLALATIAWVIAEGYGEGIDNDAGTESTQSTVAEPYATSSDQPVTDNAAQPAEQTDQDPTAQSSTGGNDQSVSPTGTEKTQ